MSTLLIVAFLARANSSSLTLLATACDTHEELEGDTVNQQNLVACKPKTDVADTVTSRGQHSTPGIGETDFTYSCATVCNMP